MYMNAGLSISVWLCVEMNSVYVCMYMNVCVSYIKLIAKPVYVVGRF